MNLDSVKKYNNPEKTEIPAVKLTPKKDEVEKFVERRVKEMQDYREDLKIEAKWKEADVEYISEEIKLNAGRRRFETDQETGLRSRLVSISDASQDWRSNNSDPVLLSKIQTAISIIIDNNPEGLLTPLTRKYENTSALAYSIWKRNWAITNAKDKYKLFVFNLAKYGWSAGRVAPRLVQYEKECLYETDGKDATNDKYQEKTLTWFNDVDREALDPFRTWIDEQTKPYDDYSMNDWYFEKDFSWDSGLVEFKRFDFEKLVPAPRDLRMNYEEDQSQSAKEDELKKRQDIVTVGFYENRLKDLYVIRIPKLKVVLHYCPLPNDDGMLSIFQTPWVLRSASSPYGISLWEIIKQKKSLYDKMMNMTMDQLVLSIMKMFFYTGTNNLIGDGKIKIEPGKGVQIVNGKVDFLEVPGPGKDAYEGLKMLRGGMDDDSGVTPTLSGELSDKNTLGEVLHAKEGALKRLKIPVENIADAIEQDAYLTLSWSGQVLSTVEIKKFADTTEIEMYELENGVKRQETEALGGVDSETGESKGPYSTTFLPEISLALEKQGDKLVESRTERFFAIGSDIKPGQLRWKGIFKVIPKSILASSTELEKQRKMELFNIMVPLLGMDPQLFAKPVKQLLKVNEEKAQDWLPDSWMQYLDADAKSLFIKAPMGKPNGMAGMGQQPGVSSNQTSIQGGAGTTPGMRAPTVVPQSQMSNPEIPGINAAPRQEMTRSI